MVFGWILVGLIANTVVGAVVCGLVDQWCFGDKQKLLKWAQDGPSTIVVTQFWPIILIFGVRYKWREKHSGS